MDGIKINDEIATRLAKLLARNDDIQSIITAIVGFIAYFIYDYGSNIASIPYYLCYKSISILLFLASVFFLYLICCNLFPEKVTQSKTENILNKPNANPYTNRAMNGHSLKDSQIRTNAPQKRDELYFTNKSMLNRVSSTVLKSSEPKYDFHSSPNKMNALNPNKIATHKNLSHFLQNQSSKFHSNATDNYNRVESTILSPPSVTAINQSNHTPIGKAFGSMRMTPAIHNKGFDAVRQSIWNTPNKLDNSLVILALTQFRAQIAKNSL
ncbi:MAG: hypothetical protein GY938_13310, partial [Ketobacter sp.]|nr:hypothetical protein [Ketobacter sp.]